MRLPGQLQGLLGSQVLVDGSGVVVIGLLLPAVEAATIAAVLTAAFCTALCNTRTITRT